jgi:hypothetical protein
MNLKFIRAVKMLVATVLLLTGGAGSLRAQSYCIPSTNNNCKDPFLPNYYGNITNVTFAGMSNNSVVTTCGTTNRGYSDYSSTVTPPMVNADGLTPYNYSIFRQTTANSNYRMAIWIDLNNDGIFDNTNNNLISNPTGERFLEAFMGNNTPITGSIILPAGISSGNKRMRVRAMYTQTGYSGPSPCAPQDYGEAEDYTISVSGSAAVSISTGSLSNASYCPDASVNIPFTISGNFNPGNVFTAQLSDANGNFSNPVSLGTLNGTSPGTINGAFPSNTPAGNNYRIRVIGSDPLVTGSDNGSTIAVLQKPQIPAPLTSATSICPQGTVTLTANPSPVNASITWSVSVDGSNFSPISGASGSPYNTTPISQTSWFKALASNTCGTVESPSVEITVSGVSQISISRKPETFNLCNGPITLSVPSNITNFTWNNNQTGNSLTVNAPGVYSGTGTDASGCQANAEEVTIIETVPPALFTTPSGEFSTCSNSALLSASEGFQQYIWSDNQNTREITVSASGTYAVTGIDAEGCRRTSDSLFVTFDNSIPAPLVVSPESPAVFCTGGTVTLSAEEGYDIYAWTGGINGRTIEVNQPGFYSVTAIKADGCQGKSEDIEVLEKTVPVASFTYQQPSGYLLVFTNTSQGATSFTWLISSSTTTSENASFTFPFDGIYPITLIATNECGSDTTLVNVEVKKIVGIHDPLITNASVIYMKESALLYINAGKMLPEKTQISIVNSTGQLIQSETLHSIGTSYTNIMTRALSGGIYFCLVQGGNMNIRLKFLVF